MHAPRRKVYLAIVVSAVVVALAAVLFACSQTPTSVPVRTFERAQRMDVVCLQLYQNSKPFDKIQPRGMAQNECSPVATDGDPGINQLFALVTQSARGEVAVVDLSAGILVDTQRAVPGVNFLPVGALPTDIASTPDGVMVFVASAEPNKPAIYGIPTRRILGDTPGFPRDPNAVSLGSWPVCSLPQNPGAMTVVPRKAQAAAPADAGAGEGGADGGAAPGADDPEYDLVVVLPGDRRNSAKIVTIDPRPFRRGGLPTKADGSPDYDFAVPGTSSKYDALLTPGDVLRPGEMLPCRVTSAKELVGESSVPKTAPVGPAWDDGVKYVDGGVDLTCLRPVKSAGCGLEPCCTPARTFPSAPSDAGTTSTDAGPSDAAAPALACDDAGTPDAGPTNLDFGPLDPPRLVSVVRDESLLYIADEGVPLIHLVDMSDPRAPRELDPFVATSQADPKRVVKIKELAISPPTREFKRFLYAIDRVEGSIIVYDVSNGVNSPRVPMTRPHPELNPFQPIDRIAYSQPVVSVTFARNEVPLGQVGGGKRVDAASGLLCNPNRNLDSNPLRDLGYFYRSDSTDPGIDLGPRRLRGIFAFATLASGRVNVINVDDWDAPCRRPENLASASSDVSPAQPAPISADDLDPYHVPEARPGSVTNEVFLTVSAPHTPRSDVLIRDDPETGNQIPRQASAPTVQTGASAILPTVGPESAGTPILTGGFATEVPDVHVAQDWRATYEGAIPGLKGTAAVVSTQDNYSTVVLTQGQSSFCSRGIEDFDIGKDRATKILSELRADGKAVPKTPLDNRIADYVRLTEDFLDPADPYWSANLASNDPAECWGSRKDPRERYDVCRATFGTAGEGSLSRDFPILEAYSDHLVIGRFYAQTSAGVPLPREVVGRDPTNADILRLMRCCFHHQIRFEVRASNEWVVVGNPGADGVGFLNHITAGPGGRCVNSCDIRESLLNGRVPAVDAVPLLNRNGRNSARAMRNPMFAITIANPVNGASIPRDTFYSFSTRGEFKYLGISIAGTSTAVNPQSMRFIDALGQIGVVDGASQGLVLIDLRAVTVARAPYF